MLMGGYSFLRKQEELQLGPEEVNFTCICLGNLTLASHDEDNSEDSIRGYIREGYYGLSDYSVVYWQEHLDKIIRGKALDSEGSLDAFNTAIHSFLSKRFTTGTKTANGGAKSSSHLNRFQDAAFYSHLVQAMEHTNNEQSSISNPSQRYQPMVAQLLTVRETMERVVLEADCSLKKRLQILYGPNLFKCPELRCKFFHEGFSIASERDAHTSKHKRAFSCTHPGCPSALIGFTTSTELNKHNVDYHGAAMDKDLYPWNGNIASININKQIRNGNLFDVQAWADQWAQIPLERLWFVDKNNSFETSPLGLTISLQQRDIFEALLSQAPDDLFERTQEPLSELQPIGYQLFTHILTSGNEDIATVYLRKLDRIGRSLFTSALQLDLGSNMITLLLHHATTNGKRDFRDDKISYLKAAVKAKHAESTRYLLFNLGLLKEIQIITDLASSGNHAFLAKIVPTNCDAMRAIRSYELPEYCEAGDGHQVANLLKHEWINPNILDIRGSTPLILAIKNGHEEIVQQLVADHRVDLDQRDGHALSALHWALLKNQPTLVATFLGAGISVSNITLLVRMDGAVTTAVEYSKNIDHSDVQHQLAKYLSANTNWNLYPPDSTMLIRFCAAGNLQLVRKILQRNLQDLDTADSRGVTPFLQAVKCGQHQIVQFLLEKGCNTMSFERPIKTSALAFAVMQDDLQMVRLLLSNARVDPSYKNPFGYTALDYLNHDSLIADKIRDEIEDAIAVASVFQNVDG